ncbi:hypothetical protein Leryth_025772 [Lithospermum erythrorhizon]|nr:hypothetical protein Leryth_025772 [Lithospermum erythrorhizon]
MFPSGTSEPPSFAQFPQYPYTSTFGSSINNPNHVVAEKQERTETPNQFITENVNFYYNDPLVNNDTVVFPSRIVQSPVGKKDKHSKIVTARGPRDRRVRLSIDIAKKFFGLQDMLRFDKASKTIDWLLTKSKSAIEDLAHKQTEQQGFVQVTTNVENGDLGEVEKFAKELRRAKARARARERTRRKMCGALFPNQSLSLMRNKCTAFTRIKEDVELDNQVSNNREELSHMNNNGIVPPKESSHRDILSPCSTAENSWDLSRIVASMNTQKGKFSEQLL